jgi:predicted nucleotidyltransferase
MATSTLKTVRLKLAAQEAELRRRGVRYLGVFGSVARGEDSGNSDVDLAVEIEEGRPFSLIRMEEARLLLQDALGWPVDIGEIDSFRPGVRAAFERNRIVVFLWPSGCRLNHAPHFKATIKSFGSAQPMR